MKPNPYEPPSALRRLSGRDIVVRNSRLPAWEFARLADRPIAGRFVWLLGKLRLVNLETTIPAPRPLAEEICAPSEIPSHVQRLVEPALDDARHLGFTDESWSGWAADHGEISAAAVRSLHKDRKFFLQIVASGNKTLGLSETHLVSYAATGEHAECTFTTSNSHPKYRLPTFAHAHYARGASLGDLMRIHQDEYGSMFETFQSIECFDEIASIVDSINFRHAKYMMERGIWIER